MKQLIYSQLIMLSLENKVAIVTGAGSGLGKEIALLFAKQGAQVIAVGRTLEKLEKLASDQEIGSSIFALAGDISDPESVKNLFTKTQEKYGAVDIVVNNAGVMDQLDPVGDLSDEMFDKVININLKGTFYMMREAVNSFKKQDKGVIVNIASIAGMFGGRAGAAYTASKHGIIGLTKNTAHAYAKEGIRCNAIAPGAMKTEIMNENLNLQNAGKLIKNMFSTQGNQIIGDPLQVAQLALFLASDEADFINGAVVVADGGWSAY